MKYASIFVFVALVILTACYVLSRHEPRRVTDTDHAIAPASIVHESAVASSPSAVDGTRRTEKTTTRTVPFSQPPQAKRENDSSAKTDTAVANPEAPSRGPKPENVSATGSGQQGESPKESAAELLAKMVTDDGESAFGNPSAQAHQTLESENPDEEWSAAAAQQLRDYLEGQLGGRFEYPLIDCRQNICEIQAASMGGSNADDLRDFQMVFGQMHAQPWWLSLQFDEQTLRVQGADGRVLIVCFITRQ